MAKRGRVEEMCDEIATLMAEQVAVIKERGLDFSKEEFADFERRRQRVWELKAAIDKLSAEMKD